MAPDEAAPPAAPPPRSSGHSRRWWSRTLFVIAVEEMAHRPPLPRRWLVYCVVAYLVPILALALPDEVGALREVAWLVTLAPAFILSLHYGMLGALAGLVAGTLLYLTVMLVMNLNVLETDQEVLLPIYVSYGMLAIAVGWLSQQLHEFYHRALRSERLAVVGEVAVTLRHELNNALQAITAEAGVLRLSPGLAPTDREGVETILTMAKRIQDDVRQLADLPEATSVTYAGETKMVGLDPVTGGTQGT